jgi:hypothetical protein
MVDDMSLQTETSKSFNKGLNTVQNELSLDDRYSVVADNVWRAHDGSISTRWGTRLIVDTAPYGAKPIIKSKYFGSYTICVDTAGQIWAVNSIGTVTPVWNAEQYVTNG